MDYQSAIEYLYRFPDFERGVGAGQPAGVFRLDRIRQLLAEIGNPQLAAPVIHLAGTKGKGSTAALIEAILRRAGLRTGLYTSPHLHDFAERIRIDGRPIAPAEITSAIESLRPVLAGRCRPAAEGGLTTFEVATALAFTCFRRAEVQVMVIETGLGGRLDATNVVQPAVAVITTIGHDHQAILGEDIASIAAEKAGILKSGCRIVIGPQPGAALDVILARCAELGNRPRLYTVGHSVLAAPPTTTGQDVFIFTPKARRAPYQAHLPLIGRHQAENAAVAAAAVEEFLSRPEAGFYKPDQIRAAVEGGLAEVRWPARFEIIHQNPWLVVDGAHTGESAGRVAETLAEVFPGRPVTILIGVSREKNVAAIAAAYRPIAGRFVATAADHPRALDADTLQARIQATGAVCDRAATTWQAIDEWRAGAAPGAVAIATGSLFVAAEALRWPGVRRADRRSTDNLAPNAGRPA